ncbi:YHS domain-containing (seleno)protein [Rubritalea sp.]|uniref:YHS domain-containing (seleno)protein n=1 Tax=Rubritalea sp. TaxID=2109375 RepID=UPI003EF67EEF
MKILTLFTVLIALITSLHAAPKTLALEGYCPVCYIAAGKANKGNPEITSEYKGKTYYFVSEDVKAMFDKEPTKWLPQYDGWCAYGIAKGKKFKSDPTVFSVINGKLYLNYNEEVGEKFNKDQAGFITQADKEWPNITR